MRNILFEYFEHISKHMMALFESKAAKIIDKLNEKKFKIKMLLAFMDL